MISIRAHILNCILLLIENNIFLNFTKEYNDQAEIVDIDNF